MGKVSNEIKKRLKGEVLTETEIENIMSEYGYFEVQSDESDSNDDNLQNIIKYTNYRSQIWVEFEKDEEGYILVIDTKYVTKMQGESTEVEPFHSFEDMNNILKYFSDNEKNHHWLISCLMVSLGRRINDIILLKWSDIYLSNGKFRDRLTTLKEEKTGKKLGVRLHDYARECIRTYCEKEEINPMEHYSERLFDIGSAAYRSALKIAIDKVGIDYPVSTHSFRKYYGNTMYKLHPNDADAIKMVQFQFGHTNEEITRLYIGNIDEKIDRYNRDYSNFLIQKSNGNEFEIDGSPVITFKTNDLRNVLKKAFLLGRNNNDKDDIEVMNKLIALAEENMIS